jgi:hypothetical protein
MNQDLKRTLWAAADKLRSNMDAAEYKHIVLGLIFLKYISDAFDERRAQLRAAFKHEAGDLHLPDAADHAAALEEVLGAAAAEPDALPQPRRRDGGGRRGTHRDGQEVLGGRAARRSPGLEQRRDGLL